MIVRNFKLYLHAGATSPLVINANQYDHNEQWVFELYDSNNQKYTPSTGAIVGIKSDGLGIINTATVDSNGRVVVNETEQMTAAAGRAEFELMIDSAVHGTANFYVLVEPKPGDNADLSETDISMIEQAIEAASTIKPYGSPLVASTVAGMTDHDKVYVYVGSETGYTSGNWYYWDGSAWTSGGVYNSVAVQTDTTLTLSGVAADAKKTGDEISDLKSAIDQLEAIPWAVKQAMDSLFAKSAYADDDVSSDYAVFHAWANAVNLLSISAVYTQSGPVDVTDSLEDLRPDLVVTANYDNGSSVNVTNYVLSGTLEVGTSVITVTFEGKTTTFNVNVTQYWTWNYKASDGLKLSERTDLFNVTYKDGTETIEDGLLHVNINTGATATVNRYEFKSPTTNTNAILETRVKFAVIPIATDSVAFTPMLSNGTGGAKIGQYRTSTSASPVFATHIGNAKTEHALTLDTWYTIKLVLENGKQSVYLNDVALIENVGLSTYYCTSNRINFQKTGNTATAPLEMYVDYIRYKNNDL